MSEHFFLGLLFLYSAAIMLHWTISKSHRDLFWSIMILATFGIAITIAIDRFRTHGILLAILFIIFSRILRRVMITITPNFFWDDPENREYYFVKIF